MNAALELKLEKGEAGEQLLRSPGVGLLTEAAPAGQLLAPGAKAGSLLVLGRCHPLIVPAGARGQVVSEAPERVHQPVGYGDLLWRLAPLSADGEAGAAEQEESAEAGGLLIRASMAGRIWLRPRPEADAFVQVGATVGSGDALVLIEVMKTFTRVHYQPGGGLPERARIARVLVEDGQEVEEGEPLYALEDSAS